LKFSPFAWAKLLYFRDKSDNEVGGFGITEPDDLLFVKDFATVKQKVDAISVKFNDEAVADFFDDQVDLGKKPEQFARIWLHTHPGDSPEPSTVDEETFERVFGSCQWAVMFILAQDNRSSAKLSFNVGPGGRILIPVQVDYSCEFGSSEHEKWDEEYQVNIEADHLYERLSNSKNTLTDNDFSNYVLPVDVIDQLENMEPCERQFILNELAARPDLWNEETEDIFL